MKFNPLRKLYNWVLTWAEKPSAQLALFILAFAESSFFPVPPDVLLIPLVLGFRKKWFRLALTVTVASALGGMFGYLIGLKLWWLGSGDYTPYTPIANFFFNHIFSEAMFLKMQTVYEKWNFWIVFTAGFTPIPYKVFTVSAGAFKVNFVIFLFASIISRGCRFFLVSFLIYKFGEPIKRFIDKYFNWLALLLTILLIGEFVLIKGLI